LAPKNICRMDWFYTHTIDLSPDGGDPSPFLFLTPPPVFGLDWKLFNTISLESFSPLLGLPLALLAPPPFSLSGILLIAQGPHTKIHRVPSKFPFMCPPLFFVCSPSLGAPPFSLRKKGRRIFSSFHPLLTQIKPLCSRTFSPPGLCLLSFRLTTVNSLFFFLGIKIVFFRGCLFSALRPPLSSPLTFYDFRATCLLHSLCSKLL